jgi:hypothetical protein
VRTTGVRVIDAGGVGAGLPKVRTQLARETSQDDVTSPSDLLMKI